MISTRPFRPADWLLVLFVLAVAGGARAWYLCEFADCGYLEPGAGWHVQDPRPELEMLVENLNQRGIPAGFRSLAPLAAGEEATAHVGPGYPVFRSLIETAVRRYLAEQLDPLATLRWVQVALGTLTAGLYFAVARRAFASRGVGLLAGLFSAVYPFWVINAAELDDGTLATFCVAAVLALGVRAGQQGGALTSFLYGLLLALAALVRAALLSFAVVAVLWFLWRSRRLPVGWLYALLAFLGFVNGLAPWVVRNYQVFGVPVPIVDTGWWHLWVGNNPRATGGPFTEAMGETLPPERRAQLTAEKQPRRYEMLSEEVLAEVWANPVLTVQRRLYAGVYFFTSAAVLDDEQATAIVEGASPSVPAWVHGALYGSLFALLLLAVLGWRWSYGWRRLSMPLQLAVFWIPLPYLLTHAATLHGPRLPLDGPLLCLAALALACLVPGSRLARGEAEAAVGEDTLLVDRSTDRPA
jgi:4-amino-4-deoxy-L-arabinose transferase-like glycosyltransferase